MEILKNQGNTFFNESKFEEALEKYLEALKICEEDSKKLIDLDESIDFNSKMNDSDTEDEEEQTEEITDDRVHSKQSKDEEILPDSIKNLNKEKSILNSNICATYCGLKNYGKAIEFAVESTKLNPKWFKSWFRLATVLYNLEKYEQALTSIDKSIECFKEENEQNTEDFSSKIFILTDLKDQIERKNEVYKKKNKLKKSLEPSMEELFNDTELNEKLNDKDFREKFDKLGGNPMEMLKDPEMLNLVNNIASKVDKDKLFSALNQNLN